MKRIFVPLLAVFISFANLYGQSLDSFVMNIEEVRGHKDNEVRSGYESYISFSNGIATVRFHPEAEIVNRTSLERNFFEREGKIVNLKKDGKGRTKFTLEFGDNHNTRDFYIDVIQDRNGDGFTGTVYYYGKVQSQIRGSITMQP